ncbi:hypothetical protein AB0M43_36565 [Longispora sp. NPDC051575]
MSRSLPNDLQRRWRVALVVAFLATLVVCSSGVVYLAVKGRAHAEVPR